MIPRDYITEWRRQTPWVQDFQVEQDLVISRALVEIFSHPVLKGALAFRGGTALYKLHLKPARYSEDIDLVQVTAGRSGSAMEGVREVLDPWLGRPCAGAKLLGVESGARVNAGFRRSEAVVAVLKR